MLYARSRPRPGSAVDEPETGRRLVKLLPSQMAALRLFLGLVGRLRVPVAAGWRSRRVRPAVITARGGGCCT
ncbi:DUF6417 family protein [Streptomyces europaeiscabiei]|nr:DUF6417 family protein [Streptomyces europaeiscabiei]